MTAGICHFAAYTGTVVIAEGVETAAEADALLSIGVTLGQETQMLGQGFFLGRPTTLGDASSA
jgi:EAL domain-containing protein (putative c-di-GMP-specific phosphodiesterase class I)